MGQYDSLVITYPEPNKSSRLVRDLKETSKLPSNSGWSGFRDESRNDSCECTCSEPSDGSTSICALVFFATVHLHM